MISMEWNNVMCRIQRETANPITLQQNNIARNDNKPIKVEEKRKNEKGKRREVVGEPISQSVH